MYLELFLRQIIYPGRDQPPFVFRALSLLAPIHTMTFRSILVILITLISFVPKGEAQFIQRWNWQPLPIPGTHTDYVNVPFWHREAHLNLQPVLFLQRRVSTATSNILFDLVIPIPYLTNCIISGRSRVCVRWLRLSSWPFYFAKQPDSQI